MKHCPDCGGKLKKGKEKHEKHLGTTTLFKCLKCQEAWVVEYDTYEQRETIYRAGNENDGD